MIWLCTELTDQTRCEAGESDLFAASETGASENDVATCLISDYYAWYCCLFQRILVSPSVTISSMTSA